MIDSAVMPKKPEFLTDYEHALIFGEAPKHLQKSQVNMRLTADALAILDAEAAKMGTNRTGALEYILREIRQLNAKGRRKVPEPE
jgi:hypothetical protein